SSFLPAPPPPPPYPLSLHDALPISAPPFHPAGPAMATLLMGPAGSVGSNRNPVPMTPAFLSLYVPPAMGMAGGTYNDRNAGVIGDRKSTRLNSSHVAISYAVFCLKK